MKILPHQLYRQLTPILLIPLLATALTGIIYGICDRIFSLPATIANSLITIHQGLFLGTKIAPIYALLMGLGVFALGLKALIETKNSLLSWQNTQSTRGNIYRLLVLFIVIPLAFCVETGVAYQIGRDWFGMSREQARVFLNIHGGTFFGTSLGILYILTAGLGLIGLLIISYKNSQISVVKHQQNKQSYSEAAQNNTYLSPNYSLEEVTILRKNIQVVIAIIALVFIAILTFTTGKFFIPLIIVGIMFLVPSLVISEKLINGWQAEKELRTKLYEIESESITMLKAIPDSILRVSQEGICLNYMPAKEGKCFILDGDIINRHLTEFLSPQIAKQFIKFIQLTLDNGSTHVYYFYVYIDDIEQYYEARINPIGQTEVLIMVREISNLHDIAIEPLENTENNIYNKPIQLLTEAELTKVLEKVVQDIQHNPQNHILFCLAIEEAEPNNNDTFYLDEAVMHQIANKIYIDLTFDVIARLDNNGLVILVKDCSLKTASMLVEDLYQSFKEFSASWERDKYLNIKVNVGLLEININNSDTTSLMNAIRTTCDMAKQKVNVKTFW